MNKKFLYKLLLIFALLAFTLLISNTKSFAADAFTHISDVYNLSYIENSTSKFQAVYDIIDNNQDCFTFTSSELPEYQVLVKTFGETEGEYSYSFISFSVPFHIFSVQNTDSRIAFRYIFESSPYEYQKYRFSIDSTGFYTGYSGDSIYNVSGKNTNYETYGYSNGYEIINSNFDILNEKGELVFQQPPLVETPVEEKQETTLALIVEGVEAKKTLAEVVGILPVVLVVIVGLLAMRKAIAFLMRILKQG